MTRRSVSFEIHRLAPEDRRLMWTLRARGGDGLLYKLPGRDYVRRIAARLRELRYVRIVGGGGNRRLALTDWGNAYLDRLMRAE